MAGMRTHVITKTSVTEECDEYRCSGHAFVTLHCSCGWRLPVGEGGSKSVDCAIALHERDMILEACGLEFKRQ